MNIGATLGLRIPHPPQCALQSGPFDFYDDFFGDGPLGSRVATPGPGVWGAGAAGSTLSGELGDPLGVTATGGIFVTDGATFSKFLEIGFMLVSFVPHAPGSNYLTIALSGGGINATWNDSALNVSFPFSELGAAATIPFDANLVGKEVVLRIANTSTLANGDPWSRLAACDITLAAGGTKPGAFEVTGQGSLQNAWGTTVVGESVSATFAAGVVISHLYAKWG